jgi:hypothetical protein
MTRRIAFIQVFSLGAFFISGFAFSQSFEGYVRSFKKIQSNAPISFGKLMQIDNLMTRQEAIKFICYGDSSKLICVSEQYNQMTEKFEGIFKYVNMPSKNMLLTMKEYFIIANSEYDCNDPKKQSTSYLKLTIVNKQFARMDSLIVYREKYDNPEIVGLINPKMEIYF